MATDDTDFAAYGLPDPRDQYGDRDSSTAPYTDKVNPEFASDVWRIMDAAEECQSFRQKSSRTDPTSSPIKCQRH